MAAPHVERRGVLYLIVCAAPPARDAQILVKLAHAAGWDVCVIATPSARSFIDIRALEAATGHPVRSDYKQPDDPDVLPPPDAIAVAPATFNTINKWAAGISDTLALGLLTEAIGKRLPVVALPFINAAQAEHPAFQRSIEQLRKEGIRLLYGPDVLQLHEPGTGSKRVALYPWRMILDALEPQMTREGSLSTFKAGPEATSVPSSPATTLRSGSLPRALVEATWA
jgi:phosphopantothenoylcysteine synthetase/decarboxylase